MGNDSQSNVVNGCTTSVKSLHKLDQNLTTLPDRTQHNATSASYIIRASPNKGIGVFANQPIKRGAVLMHDASIMTLTRGQNDITAAQVRTAFSALPQATQTRFLQLHENSLPYKSRLMRIYKSNCFGDESSSWLFLNIARINHSCAPNAEIAEIENEKDVKIVALREIEEGEEVEICYFSPFDDGAGAQRRMILEETYGFVCQCVTCGLKGKEKGLSDMRRGLISVLSHWQQGFEASPLLQLDSISDLRRSSTSAQKVLSHRRRPLRRPLTPQQKVRTNILLAHLLEAEDLVNYRLAQAYVMASVALMAQMQDVKPFIIVPAAKFVIQWLERARTIMRSVREKDSQDVMELEEACGVLTGNAYMRCAKGAFGKTVKSIGKACKGKGEEVYAVLFGSDRAFSQEELWVEYEWWRRDVGEAEVAGMD